MASQGDGDFDLFVDDIARFFSILSEPSRVKIVHAICREERSVSDIVKLTGLTQTNVSRQLNFMLAAEVVARRKVANHAYYSISDETLLNMCREVCLRIIARAEERAARNKSNKKVFLLGMFMK